AELVGEPRTVRLDGPGAAHQGPGRRHERAPDRPRRGAERGADHRRRGAALFAPVTRLLLPRAAIAPETLAEALRERGWEIEDVTAYRTVRAAPPPAATREMIKTGGFDAVCFTSSSTVRSLVGIAGKPHARTIVACIGPKTAETAAEFGLRVDVQPETAAVGPLIEALAEHAARLRAEGALPPPRKK